MTVSATSDRRRASAGAARWAAWRATWQHALSRYYRARRRWRVTPWLGRVGALLVWGLFVGGTALGVALYPQATNVECDWYTCHYPLENHSLLFTEVNQSVGLALLCSPGVLLVIMGGLSVRRFVQAVRGTWQPGPQGAQLSTAWENGVIDILRATPLTAVELVRIRFLARLYAVWEQRGLIAMGVGLLATFFVSQHVIRPIFWWLGPWGQWLAQLALVGLWAAALVAWLVALTGYATLNEVAYTPQRFSSSIWSSAAMLVLAGMVILPLVGLMLVFQRTLHLDYHTGNTVRVVGVPLMLLLTGALFSAVNYGLTQAMFRSRLSVRSG